MDKKVQKTLVSSIIAFFSVLLGVALIFSGVYAVKYKTYVKTYMDAKQNKIELADDAHIDSLLNVIKIQNIELLRMDSDYTKCYAIKVDSIKSLYELRDKNLTNEVAKLNEEISLKNTIIKHQNQIITNLQQHK